MKIVHFSDTHSGSTELTPSAFLDKRIFGILNYRIFRRRDDEEKILSMMTDKILGISPDLIVCTGDITSTGQPEEFSRALKILGGLLQNSRIKFLYVPGNHDKYVNDPACTKALYDSFRILNGGSLSLDELPVKTRIDDCEFILLDESRPTSVFSSRGYVDRDSSAMVSHWCQMPKTCPRILVGHLPLIEKHPIRNFRRTLAGQDMLLQHLRNGDIDISLCGHVHVPYGSIEDGGLREICAGSAIYSRSFGLISYDTASRIFTHSTIKF